MRRQSNLKGNLLLEFSAVSFLIMLVLAIALSGILTAEFNHHVWLLKAYEAAVGPEASRGMDPLSVPQIRRSFDNLRWTTWAAIAGGFVLLYVSLLSIVWRNSKTINRQQAALTKANVDLWAANDQLREAQERLVQERLAPILNSAGEGIYGLDLQGNITFANPAAVTMTGWTAEDLLGKSHHDTVHHSQPDGAPYPEEACPIFAVLKGAVQQVDHEVFWRKDGTSFPVRYISTPIREQDMIVGAVVTFEDITERKQAEASLKQANAELGKSERTLLKVLSDLRESHGELQALQLQLMRADKLESVGRLAAGVAHEVKNPLSIILMGTNYLSEHRQLADDESQMVLRDIREAVKRADSVIRGLLNFSATSELSLDSQPLNVVVEQALLLVKHELGRYHVTVVREFGEDLSPVRLDRSKIEQVLVNLFMNAVHAMPGGGTLTVRTYARHLTGIGPGVGYRTGDHFKIGDTVLIAEVEDTGTGIPEDLLTKIFDPFFTTKPTGQGTGLGLAVTNKIIELHGGTINIGNRNEGGTRVTMMFKAA